jgi:superfamily II helicase
MIRAPNKLLIAVFLPIICYSSTVVSVAREITDRVRVQTQLEELVARFCQEYCIGNERRGYIKNVTIEPNKTGKYRVSGKAVLQNRQVLSEPYKFVLYDHDVVLNVEGMLDDETCKLHIEKVSVENDFQGIFASLLKTQGDIIGREEVVPNCKALVGASE